MSNARNLAKVAVDANGDIGTASLDNIDLTTRVAKTGDTMTGNLIVNANVGIGTSSPNLNTNGTVLHINNSTASHAAAIHMTNAESGSNVNNGLLVGKWSDGTNYFFDYGSNPIVFGVNSIERMRIDSSGRVTMPYQPAFSAYLIANPAGNGYTTSGNYVASSTGIGFTTTTELILRHTMVNIGGHYNTSTGRFTAPVSGTYRFSYSCLPDWNQYATQAWAEFCINGSDGYNNHEMYVPNSASNPHTAQMTGSTVFTLSAGDYVSIFHRGGMHQRYTCFSGELIG